MQKQGYLDYHLEDLPRHRDDAEPSALQRQKRDGHHVRPQRGLERLSDVFKPKMSIIT